jgi:hypothetical protein
MSLLPITPSSRGFNPYISYPNMSENSLFTNTTSYPHHWFPHTSNVRSTPPDYTYPAVCKNCSSYRCMDADRQFVAAIDNKLVDGQHYRRRFEWLWSCVRKAVRHESHQRIKWMWRRLIGSDDIWMMWKDGDHLPAAPNLQYSWENLDYNDSQWELSASAIISRRLEYHSEGHCGFKTALFGINSNTLASETFEIRFVTILWKALLACKQTKYPLSPSSVDREIPSLVPKWWDIIPDSLKKDLLSIADARPAWNSFCSILKEQNHTCYEDRPNQSMWKVWMTIQDILHASVPAYLPDYSSCGQCLSLIR